MNENGQDTTPPIEEPGLLTELGDCLRASFTADNHDSLDDDSTRSLLHLSHEAKAAPMRDTGALRTTGDFRETPDGGPRRS